MLFMALVVSMVMHVEIIEVPFALWISVTTLLFTNAYLMWLLYVVLLSARAKDMLLGMLANKALTFTVNIAAINTTLNTTQKWQRTNKFLIEQNIKSAISSTSVETIIGLSLVLFTAAMYVALPYQGLLAMCLLGLFFKGIDHLAAPVVAIIAVRSSQVEYGKTTSRTFNLPANVGYSFFSRFKPTSNFYRSQSH